MPKPALFPYKHLEVWYLKNARVLPWRQDARPYYVWLSEMMLQQTQVAQVVGYFQRFIARFADFQALAAAPQEEVLQLWSGLGYYSRARNLHRAAQMVVSDFGGELPRTPEEIQRLPGVGRYSAGAVLSIAYNLPVPILDGNVRRVLARFDLQTNEETLWKRSAQIVEEAAAQGIVPSVTNQALMELGARVCTPRNPLCPQCPLRKSCLAFARGLQSEYPPSRKALSTIEQTHAVFALMNAQNEFLIQQRGPNEKWLKTLWEFPTVQTEEKLLLDAKALQTLCFQKTGVNARNLKKLGQFNHAITRHKLTLHVYYATVPPSAAALGNWHSKDAVAQLAGSSLLRKTLALLGTI